MASKISEIIEHATSQGYKSNVVKPLAGIIVIMLLSAFMSANYGFELLATVSMGAAIFIIICFLVSYFYCLFTNPDLLRSEKYNLEKTAMEKTAITGDSTTKGKVLFPNMDYVVIESIGTTNENTLKESNENI